MKKKLYTLAVVISISILSCERRTGCLLFENTNIGLCAVTGTWSCQHNDYSWAPYDGSFDAQGKIISSDIWTPQKSHSMSLQYKQVLYCDKILLKEDDVYYSPYMYNTIDGNRHEILSVGYDHYDKSWRCTYECAIKDNDGPYYGFYTCFIEKNKADSILNMWTNFKR